MSCRTMPRTNPKASHVTEWMVQPWYPVQRTRRRVSIAETPQTAVREPEIDDRKGFSEESAAKLRQGLEKFRERFDMPQEVREPAETVGKEDWWYGPCLLAFEESNGHFVGLSLDKETSQPRLVLSGMNQTSSPIDCRFLDAQGCYDMDIAEINCPARCCHLTVVHTGGDVARLDSEETSVTSLRLCFRCIELYGNSTPSSVLRPCFEGEEVIVNVGMLWLSGWKNE